MWFISMLWSLARKDMLKLELMSLTIFDLLMANIHDTQRGVRCCFDGVNGMDYG